MDTATSTETLGRLEIIFTLPLAAMHALMFASKDEHRANLRGLRIEAQAGDSFAWAIATDGHRLLAVRFALGEMCQETFAVTLAPDAVVRAAKAKMSIVRVTLRQWQQDALLKASGDAFEGAVFEARLVEANFPDWRQVMTAPAFKALGMAGSAIKPTARAKDAFGVNAEYIAEFATYLGKCGVKKGQRGMVLHAPSTGGEPFTLIREDVELDFAAAYIVMPMRV